MSPDVCCLDNLVLKLVLILLPGNDYHFGDNPDSDSSRGVDLRPRELEKELAEEYKEDK